MGGDAVPKYLERGALAFEATELIARQVGPLHELFRVDCDPPPEGMVTTFSPPLEIAVVIEPGHLQQSELGRMLEGARTPGDVPLTADALIGELATDWRFDRVPIDLSQIPQEWRRRSLCYLTSVRYFATYAVYEVVARTRQQVTLGGEVYRTDDTVATFRLWKPLCYYFVRHFTWNPRCCPGTPPRIRADERSPEHGPGAHAVFELRLFEVRPLWTWPLGVEYHSTQTPPEEDEPSDGQ